MKWRYLDIRRPEMLANLKLRHTCLLYTSPRPLFGARRGAEAARPRGGAIPGACRTLADFLGRACATK